MPSSGKDTVSCSFGVESSNRSRAAMAGQAGNSMNVAVLHGLLVYLFLCVCPASKNGDGRCKNEAGPSGPSAAAGKVDSK